MVRSISLVLGVHIKLALGEVTASTGWASTSDFIYFSMSTLFKFLVLDFTIYEKFDILNNYGHQEARRIVIRKTST